MRLSNKLLDEFPIPFFFRIYVVHTELKNYKLAKKLFIKVVNLNPKYTDGYYNLANIFSKLDKEEEIIENYKKVIELEKIILKHIIILKYL